MNMAPPQTETGVCKHNAVDLVKDEAMNVGGFTSEEDVTENDC